MINKKIRWKKEIKNYRRINNYRDNTLLGSRNDSIFKLNFVSGEILFGNSMPDETDVLDLILSPRGIVKKIIGEEVIFLVDVKTGETIWTYKIPNNENLCTPFDKQIGADKHTLYINTKQGMLRAVDLKTGKLLWEFDTYSRVTSKLVIGDGVLYLVNVTGQVIAIDTNLKDGVQKWTNLRDFE